MSLSERSAKRVQDSRVELTQIMTPTDANFLGKVFGGSILSMIDLVGYMAATKFAGNVCVTASIDRVDFHDPIEVGEVVSMMGEVSYVGKTSVEVTIEVHASSVFGGERRHTNTARVTMVAIKDGRAVPVPRLICESREEKIRFLEGKTRRERRQVHQQELAQTFESFRKMSDEELHQLVSQ